MAKGNGKSQYATKADLLSIDSSALKREPVELPPPVARTVLVWELWAHEREEYLSSVNKAKQRIQMGGRRGKRPINEIEIENHAVRAQIKLCAMALKDEAGNTQWTEAELRSAKWFTSSVLERIFDAASRLSFVQEEDEDLGKDLPQTSGDDVSSSSAFTSDTEASESSATG